MEKKEETKIQKKDKAPSSLIELSKGLQNILNDLEKIEKVLDDTDIEENENKVKEEKNKEKIKDNEAEEESKGEDKEKKENKEENKEKEEVSIKEIKLLELWINLDKKIEEIHDKWNLYEIEGVKKGIDIDERERFKGSLNLLTKSIEERNIRNIYNNGSEGMLRLSPMFGMYKDEIKGSINKIKYYTYQSYLKAVEGLNREAQNLLEDLSEDINQIRQKLDKDEEKIKILDKTNLSIGDMQKALKENSIKLYRIKKDIIIKNLDELGE